MGDNYFDLITQELLEQQHHMEQLVQENQALCNQLAQLRAGKGIFIAIGEQQIALMDEDISITSPAMKAHSLAPQEVTPSSIGAAATSISLAQSPLQHAEDSAPE